MTESTLLLSTVGEVLGKHAPIGRARTLEYLSFPNTLWNLFAEMGLLCLGEDTESTNDPVSSPDRLGFEMQRKLGEHALPIPFAEHTLLAAWLLRKCDLASTNGLSISIDARRSISVETDGRMLSLRGTVPLVPWARAADTLLLIVNGRSGPAVARINRSATTVVPGFNLAGEPRDSVSIDWTGATDALVNLDQEIVDAYILRSALLTSAAISGALTRVLRMSAQYAGQRTQFGRPIARFQAIRDRLVVIAECLASTNAAVDTAIEAWGTTSAPIAVATAKVEASRCAGIAAAHAHQIHGAVGMTAEYDLQLLTRRLWSWRGEGGGLRHWARYLGNLTTGAENEHLRDLLIMDAHTPVGTGNLSTIMLPEY